jgi:hypothetical protein
MGVVRFVFLLIIMLSAGVRAFTASGTRNGFQRTFARAMTAETSIVDICSSKIKDALEATDVKVTGR